MPGPTAPPRQLLLCAALCAMFAIAPAGCRREKPPDPQAPGKALARHDGVADSLVRWIRDPSSLAPGIAVPYRSVSEAYARESPSASSGA